MIEISAKYHGAKYSSSWRKISARIRKEGGALIVLAIQDVLGTAGLYTLSEAYKERKLAGKTRPVMKRVGGKADDQPLILSQALYNALLVKFTGDKFEIGFKANQVTTPDGFNYGEYWQDKVHFLEKAIDNVSDDLGKLITRILMEELKVA